MTEEDGLSDAVRRKGSFLQTMRAVAWSFFGVRKSADHEKDVRQLNPVHVVIAGSHRCGAVHRCTAPVGELGDRKRRSQVGPDSNERLGIRRKNMSAATQHGQRPYYYVPAPSRFPVMAASGLFFVILGAGQWVNGVDWGKWSLLFGLLLWAYTMQGWFRQAISESEGGLYGDRIDTSFRWSMSWFIFSEVMFFGAFFGALFWSRLYTIPVLGSLQNAILWPDFRAIWPSVQAGATASPAGTVEPFTTMGPWPIPTINTALLLTSGVTLTIAHHMLIAGKRGATVLWMWITVILGITFLGLQAFEYIHAYHELNLKLTSGIYGSTFFMLTGFHGFHVFVGMLMLLFITIRIMRGHFTPQRHFGFEGAAWYWHFVDVVWLGLYVIVYWL
jgi:cytochrome c oxidase subunit 3